MKRHQVPTPLRLSLAAASIIGLTALVAEPAASKVVPSDQLSPSDSAYSYLDKQDQDIAQSADAMVRATPAFSGGFIVGVRLINKNWSLVGHGTTATGPMAFPSGKESCARPINGGLGTKMISLWSKALAKSGDNGWGGLDGEFYHFVLKGKGRGGIIWSPDARSQPKMSAFVRIANDMFYSCRTGKGMDDLDGQISKLLTII